MMKKIFMNAKKPEGRIGRMMASGMNGFLDCISESLVCCQDLTFEIENKDHFRL